MGRLLCGCKDCLRLRLAVASAMGPTTVEAASAMEVAAAVETTVAMEAFTAVSVTTAVIATATVVAMTVVAATPIMRPVPAVEPGAGTNEDAVHEVVRAVVAVGRAGVRIVAVVAISADRGWTDGNGASDANTDADANLGMGAACCGEEQNSQ